MQKAEGRMQKEVAGGVRGHRGRFRTAQLQIADWGSWNMDCGLLE
jgi:hypothetical protein